MQKIKNEDLGRISARDYKDSVKTSIVIVLDNIRSMNNVGSAFRTADAFRIEKIILTGITAQPPHREINKTALGATDSVPWKYIEQPAVAIELLKKVAEFEPTIESAADSRAPHRMTNYIQDLASHFHKFYNAEKVLTDDIEKTKAHIALVEAVRITLNNALALVGVSAPESM